MMKLGLRLFDPAVHALRPQEGSRLFARPSPLHAPTGLDALHPVCG